MDCDISAMFSEVVEAMKDVGYTEQEQQDIFSLLGGILQLSNVTFASSVSMDTASRWRVFILSWPPFLTAVDLSLPGPTWIFSSSSGSEGRRACD